MSNRIQKITANRLSVLETVKKNREGHAAIVAEARVGYVNKAIEWTLAKMDDLKSGKVVALACSFHPPKDYTKEYDLAISMLEMHTGTEIELDSDQVRALIRDEWDWTREFAGSNMHYSKMAADRYDLGG